MGLDTSIFLLFLGGVTLLQAWLPERGRVAMLLCASLVFYAFSSIGYLVLLVGMITINYWALVVLKQTPGERKRTMVFTGAIVANVGLLVAFKFASGPLAQLWNRFGWPHEGGGLMSIAAPLGLSYVMFQMVACVTDAYRQVWQVEGGFVRFALFGLFFPQISSGPIPRANGLAPQLANGGSPTSEDRLAGLRMMAYGFFKKFVVANCLSEYVTMVFKDPPISNTAPVWVACCLNALQLYADFSGYVDIAIGSARVLGFRLDPNFDRPLTSISLTEFWRRWHMTLSFWLRDYLYMPLVLRIRSLGKAGIALAMVVTFAICGIWHAAKWTFLVFGLAQGVVLAAEILTKPWRTKRLKRMPKPLVTVAGSLYTLGFFVLTQALFRSTDLSQAGQIYSRLFHVRLSGGLNDFLGTGPFVFALTGLAVVVWAGVSAIHRRTTDRLTPWFVLLCAVLILFMGRLGSAHFIYAAF